MNMSYRLSQSQNQKKNLFSRFEEGLLASPSHASFLSSSLGELGELELKLRGIRILGMNLEAW